MYKIFIGQAAKGGSTQQESMAISIASARLETQLNSEKVQEVQGFFMHDTNPLYVEILALAVVADPTPVKKENSYGKK